MALKKSMPLYVKASVIVAIGGLIFGLDTGTIGPVTAMSAFTDSFGPLSSTTHGLIVSAILLGGTFTGLFAGNIADIYGRALTIRIGALIFGIGAALESSAQSLGMFIAGRVIKGLGEGLFLGTVTVYVCEIAPARRRGPLASIPQFMVNVGIAMGYFIAYGTARIMGSSASWRLPLAIHSMMAFGFCGACFFVPPSPRWLLVKGRREKAIETLEQLGLDSSELEEMLVAPERSDAASVRGSLLSSIRSNFRDMGEVFHTSARKQTTLACFMMAMQQFSGIDGVLYYAPLLFQQAGLASEQAAFLASGISALAMLAVTIPASIYADHWSRRMSVMLGGLVLATFMLLIGSLYASSSVHGDHGAARWVVVVLIYLFAMTFCSTWGISIRIYASEIQPSKTRAPAANLAQSANWTANWIVAFTTPILLSRSSFAAYYFFGSLTLITVVVCGFFMPESRGKSLEAIDRAFTVHTSSIKSPLSPLRRRMPTLMKSEEIDMDIVEPRMVTQVPKDA